MLAEIFLMRLQTKVRAAARPGVMTASRFVPIAPLRDRAAGGVRPA